jgi:hypothetical protein
MRGATSFMNVLYSWIKLIADRAKNPDTRVMSFQTLASWFGVLKEILSSTDEAEVSRVAASFVGMDVFAQAYAYVFTFWEDPVDSMQHKVTC